VIPAAASAQLSFEVASARPMGMGGAFVAVANDANTVFWNPAGLASSPPVSMTVGWDRLRFGNPDLPAAIGSSEDRNQLTSVATMPLAVSYGYLHWARVVAVTPGGNPIVHTLRMHHLGGTIAQTLYDGVVVGATFKYLRGQVTTGETEGILNGDALEEALDRRTEADNKFDIDIGALVNLGPVNIGYTLKNALQPTFVGPAGFEIQLKRRSRLGISVMPADGLTLAFDVDLDTADPLVGVRRMMAFGGEIELGARTALRGGVRWTRGADRRFVGTAGASLSIKKGFWLDGYAIYSETDDRGFGVAFRAGG
jgi:hypothetical protein